MEFCIVTAAHMLQIQDVVEWDEGLPIFPALISGKYNFREFILLLVIIHHHMYACTIKLKIFYEVWQRHFPLNLITQTRGNGIPFATTPVGQQFVQTFTVDYSRNSGRPGWAKDGLLRMVLSFKRIRLIDGRRQQMTISKNNDVLLSYDDAHPQQAIVTGGKGIEGEIYKIALTYWTLL